MTGLGSDPRWRRFNDTATPCSCCGRTFNGIFDIAFDHPDIWPHGNRSDSGEKQLIVGDDQLSADLCRFEMHRFIRCTLPLPLAGSDQAFHFGAWASVKPENFDRYTAAWHNEAWQDFDGCFAWLANSLPEFDCTESIACNLTPTDSAGRPQLFAQSAHAEFFAAQENGITFDKLLDIYATTGNDLRPHLMDA